MFIFRVVFWLSLVVLILPVDKEKLDTTVSQSISTGDALSIAGGALSDLSGFCARNPDVCIQGQEAFVAFSVKAKYVSALAYSYINEQMNENSDKQTNSAQALEVKSQIQS